MNTLLKRSILIALALSALFLAGCKNGPVGLFESIAGEIPGAKPSKGFRIATPTNVVVVGDTYYAAIGRLWQRPVSGGTWRLTSATRDYQIGDLVHDGTILYGLFMAADGSKTIRSYDGTTLSAPITVNLDTDHILGGLLAAGTQVFAWSYEHDDEADPKTVYSIYDITAGGVARITDATSGAPSDIAVVGGTYWITAGSTVFSGAADSLSNATVPGSQTFGGIAYDGTDLILTTRTGKVFSSADGTDWDEILSASNTTFSRPLVAVQDTNRYLLLPARRLGSSQDQILGYRAYDIGGGLPASLTSPISEPLASPANYYSSLRPLSIERIVALPGSGSGTINLFACTGGGGLWSNHYNGSSWSGWVRESDR